MPAWEAAGYDIDTTPASDGAASAVAEAAANPAASPTYKASLRSDLVKGMGDVKAALAAEGAQVLDARPAPRFRGEAPEPRADVPSGHMPGVRSIRLPAQPDCELWHMRCYRRRPLPACNRST